LHANQIPSDSPLAKGENNSPFVKGGREDFSKFQKALSKLKWKMNRTKKLVIIIFIYNRMGYILSSKPTYWLLLAMLNLTASFIAVPINA